MDDVASSTGRTRSMSASSPPAMIRSLPASAVATLPETGASTNAAAGRAHAVAEVRDRPRTDRAHVDRDLPGTEALERAAVAPVHGLDGRRVGEHAHDDVGVPRRLARRVSATVAPMAVATSSAFARVRL